MSHGGDIYRNHIHTDHSVSLNPAGTPGEIYEALSLGIAHSAQYPDIRQERVRRALSASDGVSSECVWAGNGASELIMAITGFVNPHKAVLFTPCFEGYAHALEALDDCEIIRIPLMAGNGFSGTLNDFSLHNLDFCFNHHLAELMPDDADMAFICDPWNPVGRNIDESELMTFLELASAHGIKVLLDESFYHLSDRAAAADQRDVERLIREHPGLFIVRSHTKLFALPGIRMGYVIADEAGISGIRSRLPEWNLSQPAAYAMEAGAGVIADGTYVRASLDLIRREREYLMHELGEAGCRTFKSDSVFIMFQSDVELYEPLLAEGILIRDLRDVPGLGDGYYRICIRTGQENERLVSEIRRIRKE